MLLFALLLACTEEEEPTYVQYNGEADSVTIDVGVETRYVTDEDGNEVEESVSTPLSSSTGAVEVGTGTVTPSSGPIGTIHRVTVEVLDEYAEDVDRVTVRTESGDRGEDEFELERDSAGAGWWVFEIESVGDDGEQRTDTLTFRLWQEESDDSEE